MATAKGLIKKTALSEFASIRKVGKIAISIVEGDSLISVQLSKGNDNVIMASHDGKCILFSETDVRPTGRDTQGVKGMEIDDGDYIVDMSVIRDDCEIITIAENGYGKRSEISDYRLQNRGGKGVKAGTFNEKTGKLVSLKLISKDEDLMLITNSGIIIRVSSDDISKIGRDTQGVKIMRIDDSTVSGIAITPKEEIEETDENADALIETANETQE